jgi:hypothetical protein
VLWDAAPVTEDMRTAICTKIHRWQFAQSNVAKQAAQGHHGAEGGRGRKKTLTTDSSTGFKEPKTRARDARSTVGQIAASAKVSHHKAAQADAVAKAAADVLDQVATGAVKLKDAAKKVKAAAPEPPAKRPEPNYLDAKTRGLGKLQDVMRELNNVYKAYPTKQEDLSAAVDKLVSFGPPPVGGMRLLFGGGVRKVPPKPQ